MVNTDGFIPSWIIQFISRCIWQSQGKSTNDRITCIPRNIWQLEQCFWDPTQCSPPSKFWDFKSPPNVNPLTPSVGVNHYSSSAPGLDPVHNRPRGVVRNHICTESWEIRESLPLFLVRIGAFQLNEELQNLDFVVLGPFFSWNRCTHCSENRKFDDKPRKPFGIHFQNKNSERSLFSQHSVQIWDKAELAQ